MNLKIANNAASKLTGGVSPTDTDFLIDPADDGKFPVIASVGASYFRITLEDAVKNIEVVKCNQHVSGSNTLKCTSAGNRGQEGTVARTWVVGDVVEVRVTNSDLADIGALGEAAQATADAHIADTTDAHDETAINDISQDVAAMQAVVDPGEVGTESLPTDLAGEIKRLRNMIKEITGKAKWYESPASIAAFLAAANTFTAIQTISGSVSPELDLVPTSGATKTTAISQTANIFNLGAKGIANQVQVNLAAPDGSLTIDASGDLGIRKLSAGTVPLARMQRIYVENYAANNGGSGPPLPSVDLGTVNTGDTILLSLNGQVGLTAAANGSFFVQLGKSGTATVKVAGQPFAGGFIIDMFTQATSSAGSANYAFSNTWQIQVTTGGTLTLSYGTIVATGGTLSTTEGTQINGISARVLNNG